MGASFVSSKPTGTAWVIQNDKSLKSQVVTIEDKKHEVASK